MEEEMETRGQSQEKPDSNGSFTRTGEADGDGEKSPIREEVESRRETESEMETADHQENVLAPARKRRKKTVGSLPELEKAVGSWSLKNSSSKSQQSNSSLTIDYVGIEPLEDLLSTMFVYPCSDDEEFLQTVDLLSSRGVQITNAPAGTNDQGHDNDNKKMIANNSASSSRDINRNYNGSGNGNGSITEDNERVEQLYQKLKADLQAAGAFDDNHSSNGEEEDDDELANQELDKIILVNRHVRIETTEDLVNFLEDDQEGEERSFEAQRPGFSSPDPRLGRARKLRTDSITASIEELNINHDSDVGSSMPVPAEGDDSSSSGDVVFLTEILNEPPIFSKEIESLISNKVEVPKTSQDSRLDIHIKQEQINPGFEDIPPLTDGEIDIGRLDADMILGLCSANVDVLDSLKIQQYLLSNSGGHHSELVGGGHCHSSNFNISSDGLLSSSNTSICSGRDSPHLGSSCERDNEKENVVEFVNKNQNQADCEKVKESESISIQAESGLESEREVKNRVIEINEYAENDGERSRCDGPRPEVSSDREDDQDIAVAEILRRNKIKPCVIILTRVKVVPEISDMESSNSSDGEVDAREELDAATASRSIGQTEGMNREHIIDDGSEEIKQNSNAKREPVTGEDKSVLIKQPCGRGRPKINSKPTTSSVKVGGQSSVQVLKKEKSETEKDSKPGRRRSKSDDASGNEPSSANKSSGNEPLPAKTSSGNEPSPAMPSASSSTNPKRKKSAMSRLLKNIESDLVNVITVPFEGKTRRQTKEIMSSPTKIGKPSSISSIDKHSSDHEVAPSVVKPGSKCTLNELSPTKSSHSHAETETDSMSVSSKSSSSVHPSSNKTEQFLGRHLAKDAPEVALTDEFEPAPQMPVYPKPNFSSYPTSPPSSSSSSSSSSDVYIPVLPVKRRKKITEIAHEKIVHEDEVVILEDKPVVKKVLTKSEVKAIVERMNVEMSKPSPDIQLVSTLLDETFDYRKDLFQSMHYDIQKSRKKFPALFHYELMKAEFHRLKKSALCKMNILEDELESQLRNACKSIKRQPGSKKRHPIWIEAINIAKNSNISPLQEKVCGMICLCFFLADDPIAKKLFRIRKKTEALRWKGVPAPTLEIVDTELYSEAALSMWIFIDGIKCIKVPNFYEGVLTLYAVHYCFDIEYQTEIEELFIYFDRILKII